MREFVLRMFAIAQKKWIMRSLFAATGASAGFAYYYFIGCNSGTCPISGNPYISTLYGAVMGILAFIRYKKVECQIDADTYQPSLILDILLTLSLFAIGIFLIIYLVHSI